MPVRPKCLTSPLARNTRRKVARQRWREREKKSKKIEHINERMFAFSSAILCTTSPPSSLRLPASHAQGYGKIRAEFVSSYVFQSISTKLRLISVLLFAPLLLLPPHISPSSGGGSSLCCSLLFLCLCFRFPSSLGRAGRDVFDCFRFINHFVWWQADVFGAVSFPLPSAVVPLLHALHATLTRAVMGCYLLSLY